MGKVRVCSVTVSIDGYMAGPDQSEQAPMGRGVEGLNDWAFATRTFRALHGAPDGAGGVDDEMMAAGFEGVGAWILGRNMFGPDRGPWGEPAWTGWWGDEPPYHTPVFVLTHHPRPPLEMAGGTTFFFETQGPEAALRRAQDAAGGGDVRIGGGARTIAQYMRLGLVDEVHLALAPVLIGRGERPFEGVDLAAAGYGAARILPGERATHLLFRRADEPVAAA